MASASAFLSPRAPRRDSGSYHLGGAASSEPSDGGRKARPVGGEAQVPALALDRVLLEDEARDEEEVDNPPDQRPAEREQHGEARPRPVQVDPVRPEHPEEEPEQIGEGPPLERILVQVFEDLRRDLLGHSFILWPGHGR